MSDFGALHPSSRSEAENRITCQFTVLNLFTEGRIVTGQYCFIIYYFRGKKMKYTILITFILMCISNITAQIINRQDSVPIPQHVLTDRNEESHKTSIPNFQLSAFMGVVFLKQEKATALVGKNNLVHFGGELTLGHYSNFRMIPFIGAQGYFFKLSPEIKEKAKLPIARNFQMSLGFRAPMIERTESSVYVETACVLGEMGITNYAYYTRFIGLHLGIGAEHSMSDGYLRCFAEIAYDSNWELRKYRLMNTMYDLNQLQLQIGLRF